MATEGATTQVQAYLDKHKISSLFEELMSKIVKDLPADPLEYLVGKIQALQRQKKQGVSPRGTAALRGRSKIQVTGTAVTPKSSAISKERLTKSTGSARPTKPRTELVSSSIPSLSKTTPTKSRLPIKTSSRPTTASKTTSTSKSSTTPSRSIPVAKRPTTAPAPGATSRSSQLKPPSTASKTKLSSTAKVSSAKKTTPGDATKSKQVTPKKVPTTKIVARPKEATKPVSKKSTPAEDIDEFFGEPRKSSPSQLRVDSEDEDSDVGGRHSDSDDSDGVRVGRGDSVRVGRGDGSDSGHEDDKSLNLDELILKHNMSCKHAKKAQNQKMIHSLLAPSSLDETTPSIGYYSNSDDSEEESEGLEMAEDYDALEDEGVTGMTRGKYTIRETPSHEAARFDLKVLICARCARVLTGEDQGTEVTQSELTGSSLHTGDFESASHVGSHASFPQWEAGSAVDTEMSSEHISSRSHDSGSDVTLQSHDTWGGLAPQPRLQVASASDVESEIQLPTPPPLEGKPWIQDPTPQHDAYGWGQHREEDNH